MVKNKQFVEVPYGIFKLNLSQGAINVYLSLRYFENLYAGNKNYFFIPNQRLQEQAKISRRETLIKYKKELLEKEAIINLPKAHVIVSPSGQRLEVGYCAYYLPDLDAPKEEQQKVYDEIIRDIENLGIVAAYMFR